ncbi:MAG TPA: DMT family transporter [Spirochaetales bacterium]|nr:DMT family transporter [Spirochaetales bacterium]HPG86150.1 DMT family transporter [Spirochaetales bacterium]
MTTDGKRRLKGILLVNVATCAWATNIMIGRLVRDQIGPLTLTATRYVVASIVFAFVLRARPIQERRLGKDWLLLGAMSLTGVVLFAPTLYFGLSYTQAINGTLINGIGPLLTAAFAAWLLREPFSGRQLFGSVLALGGVVVLLFGSASGPSKALSLNRGDLLIVVAVTFWALYSVATRRVVRDRSPISATALSMFIGLPVLLVFAVLEHGLQPVAWTPRLIGLVVYVGLVPAALGFLCWNAGVKLLGAGGAMVFYNTLPLYGVLFGFLLLGETLGLAHLAGGALILGGGLVAAISKRASHLAVNK